MTDERRDPPTRGALLELHELGWTCRTDPRTGKGNGVQLRCYPLDKSVLQNLSGAPRVAADGRDLPCPDG